MNRILVELRRFFRLRFDLTEDKEDEAVIVASIRRNVDFRGASLWTLIFAIFIACIGLNVNSAAVVIGAMLISPLMGPIMGIGLGIGINDLDLMRHGLKNLLIAAFFSIITSTIYFWLTPLDEAQSEILARTTPSVWDVFIAFFGGLAGIVAATRKEKSNLVPGVAIATALMPPLCTAGYGLANGNYYYFLGAVYLFSINSVFIGLGTLLIVRFLKFHRREFENKGLERRVSRTILWIVVFTTLPSIYLAYRIVDNSLFEANAKKFVAGVFHFERTQVVNRSFKITGGKKTIDLLLIGEELSKQTIDSLKKQLDNYGLHQVNLVVRQGFDNREQINLSEIKAGLLQDVFTYSDSLSRDKSKDVLPDIKEELAALYPQISHYSFSNTVFHSVDTTTTDTVVLAVLHCSSRLAAEDRKRVGEWLKNRVHADSVKLIVEEE